VVPERNVDTHFILYFFKTSVSEHEVISKAKIVVDISIGWKLLQQKTQGFGRLKRMVLLRTARCYVSWAETTLSVCRTLP